MYVQENNECVEFASSDRSQSDFKKLISTYHVVSYSKNIPMKNRMQDPGGCKTGVMKRV